jgi:aquaporin Z
MTPPRAAAAAARGHWPEYAIEAAALGCFMLSACTFATLLWHPASRVHQVLGDGWAQRGVMGTLMALTAVAIVYSPWGKRSGAHMNPALTLTFARLGRVAPRDVAGYVAAHFAGGVLGVLASRALLGERLAHPAVHFVVTRPGPAGVVAAFAAEAVISALLMAAILRSAASARWRAHTGLIAGALVALYILVESPLSGMSMNPARTLGSALVAGDATSLWIYFVAPALGMLGAAELHVRRHRPVACPKLAHAEPCLFCEHAAARSGTIARGPSLQPATNGASRAALPPTGGRPWRTTRTSTSSSSAAAPAAARSPGDSRPPAPAS